MFVFGDAADATKMFLDEIMSSTKGPELPDVHFEDMSEEDLRVAMAWLHLVLTKGYRYGVDDSIIEVLTEWYDEVFTALAEASESFRERFMAGFVNPPGKRSLRRKYRAIIKAASES